MRTGWGNVKYECSGWGNLNAAQDEESYKRCFWNNSSLRRHLLHSCRCGRTKEREEKMVKTNFTRFPSSINDIFCVSNCCNINSTVPTSGSTALKMLPPSSSSPRWPSTTSPWWRTLRWTDSRNPSLFFGRSSRTPGSSPPQTLSSRWSSSLTSGIYSMRRSSTSTWGWVHLLFSWPGNFAQGLLPRVRWALLWPNRGQRIHLGPFLTRSGAKIEVQTPSDGMCKRCDVFTKLPPRVERIWGIWCQRQLTLSGIDLGQNSEKKRERSNKQGRLWFLLCVTAESLSSSSRLAQH